MNKGNGDLIYNEHTTGLGENETNGELGLSALLEQDISSFEYFNTLSPDIKRKLEAKDVSSFDEMQSCVEKFKKSK